MAPVETHEGYIPVTGGRVWYQIVGAGDAIPLLVLHGGPGIPAEVQMTLKRHEAAGAIDSQEYQQAVEEFARRHACRLQPRPAPLQRAIEGVGIPVFHTMWGPNDFTCTGNLKRYDRTNRLHEITLPVLFTCGCYDECTPTSTAWYHSLLPGSEMVVFERSSHTPHLEEPEHYLQVVRDFLRRVEARRSM